MIEESSHDDAYHLAGDRLGKFVILSELGRGSMGVVYEAFQEDLKRKVAIKVLPANISLDAKQVKRFQREAESVARLRHDNIIQIFEVGQVGNTYYFAMELVEGTSSAELAGRDPESIRRAAEIARDAARGLAHAHARGVIHRDIKPGNLLLDRTGRVLVTDFGLARLTESTSLTSTDAIVGTPKYMSPEQILLGKLKLDGRTDIYSLGAALYEIVTGRPPIEAPTVQAFLKAILEDRPPPPRRFNRQIPHDLATIILRCLEKDVDDRYAGADDLADDLDRFLQGERILAKPKGTLALGFEFVRRHRVLASLAVVATIGVAYGLWGSRQVERASRQVEKTSREKDLLDRLFAIGTTTDLDLAAEEAEALAESHPGDARVLELRASLYEKRAMQELRGPEPFVESIFQDLERAGRRGTFWHAIMLMETRRLKEARQAAEALPPEDSMRKLLLAWLDLESRKPAEALRRIDDLPGNDLSVHQQIFHLLIVARAHNARGRQLRPADAARAFSHARKKLETARKLTNRIEEAWLKSRVDLEYVDVRTLLGETFNIRDIVKDLDRALKVGLGGLVRFWGDMTASEAASAERFVREILQMAGEQIQPAALLQRAAMTRLAEAASSREKVVANLLLAVAHLSGGEATRALEALDNADAVDVDELWPYVYWGRSLVLRAQDDAREALSYAIQAIEAVFLLDTPFKDLRLLIDHAENLDLEKTAEFLDEERQRPERQGKWFSALLRQAAAAAAARLR